VDPVAVLASFSRTLLEDFEMANECSFAPNARNLMRMLGRQGKLMTDLSKEVLTMRLRMKDFESDMKEDMKNQFTGVVKVVETNNSLIQEDHVRLKEQAVLLFNEVGYLRLKCKAINSPKGKRKADYSFDLRSPEQEPSSAGAKRPRPLDFGESAESAPCGTQTTTNNIVHCTASQTVNVGTTSTSKTTNSTVTQPTAPPRTTLYAKKVACQKGLGSVTQWLIDCHHGKFFLKGEPYHKNKRNVPNSCIDVRWAHWNVAQLCWYVTTRDERAYLAAKYLDQTKESIQSYHALSAKMMNQMWLFEGDDPDIQRTVQAKSRGAGCRSGVQALGSRLK
jgi:hypothetical protein